jgi:S-DNA-T family DNA segregation ATPase FtsK/SpoIIIE
VLLPWRRSAPGAPHRGRSDLSHVVDAVADAASQSLRRSQAAPWLPPLPEQLQMEALPPIGPPERIPFGLLDLPQQQAQPAAVLDLAAGGAVLFAGTARSGRTEALRTITFESARRLSPEQLHLYVLDCAGNGLDDLAALPHCATAVRARDVDLLLGLLECLAESTARRRSATDAALQLCILDGWEQLCSALAAAHARAADRAMDDVTRLLQNCGSARTTVVVTGDRTLLGARTAGLFSQKFLLRLADPSDYALAGISPRSVPATFPPGRAMRAPEGELVHIARAAPCRPPPPSRPPADRIEVRRLPPRIGVAELPPSGGGLRLGLGGHGAQPIVLAVPLPGEPLLVTGPPGAGRTNAVRLLLAEAVRERTPVHVVAPRPGALAKDADAAGVRLSADPSRPDLPRLPPGGLLLVDDAHVLTETPLADQIAEFIAGRGDDSGRAVISAPVPQLAHAYGALLATARRSRSMLLLRPEPSDGELFGFRAPPMPGSCPPGRGVLVGTQFAARVTGDIRSGTAVAVQVAHV